MNRQIPFRTSLVMLLICLSLCLQAEEKPVTSGDTGKKVYKTRSPSGEVIFSDQPSKDAKEIPVSPGSTYQSEPVPQFTPATPERKKKDTGSYSTFQITAPANDTTLQVDVSEVTVQLTIQPGLHSGHSLQFLFDGTATDSEDTQYTYKNLERGSHTLQARIVDQNDQVIQSTAVVNIHVKRTIAR